MDADTTSGIDTTSELGATSDVLSIEDFREEMETGNIMDGGTSPDFESNR